MTDSTDDRRHGISNGTHDALIVECPQVFDGTAAARDDDDIELLIVKRVDGFDQCRRRFSALNGCRRKDHFHERQATAQRVEHIAQCRAGCRSNDADLARQFRDVLFPIRVKETFGFEHRLEPHELLIQRTFTHCADLIRIELILPLRLIHPDFAVDFHCHAIA